METGTNVNRVIVLDIGPDIIDYRQEPGFCFGLWGDIDVEQTVFPARLLDVLARLGQVSDNPGIKQTIQSRKPNDTNDTNNDALQLRTNEAENSAQNGEEIGFAGADSHSEVLEASGLSSQPSGDVDSEQVLAVTAGASNPEENGGDLGEPLVASGLHR